jgi:hypothetical protein
VSFLARPVNSGGIESWRNFMKKKQFIAQGFAIVAAGFLAQACGSSSGNVSAVTATVAPTVSLPGTVTTGSPSQVYSSCSYYGGQTTTVTSNGTNVQVCRYEAAAGQFDIGATEMNISGSNVSGGTITGLELDAGDKLEVIATGHYSPSGGYCDSDEGGGDISVLGNSDGKDVTINPTNGDNVGLWFAFEGSSGQYSSPINATVQYNGNSNQAGQSIPVPTTSTTSTLVMGYNWTGTIGCGDMGIYYAIIRCADANGNTYTCN